MAAGFAQSAPIKRFIFRKNKEFSKWSWSSQHVENCPYNILSICRLELFKAIKSWLNPFQLDGCQYPIIFIKIGNFRPSFSLFLSFQYSWEYMFNIIFCHWLDSNHGPLDSETTDLPTESQPLPYPIIFKWKYIYLICPTYPFLPCVSIFVYSRIPAPSIGIAL